MFRYLRHRKQRKASHEYLRYVVEQAHLAPLAPKVIDLTDGALRNRVAKSLDN